MNIAFQQSTDWFGVCGINGLSVIFRVFGRSSAVRNNMNIARVQACIKENPEAFASHSVVGDVL